MRTLLLPSLLLLGLLSCKEQEQMEPLCITPATVKDLTGLDGCGYVLVLSSGQRLEPRGSVWQDFPKKDGQSVQVAYHSVSGASICMVGDLVELECITPK
ncbi:hypothetical protein GCM10011383_28140 [Hymenobacter cavernae]|uniref:Uncharacterized protein n=2 Tax=Hymenobacter cavernae TaxID=2044852 RepID=A0ABQ1UC54_9BACT|nr:hypothetical protein GCM10011383_28140 [Hymenobacter cavernae]